MGATAAMPHAGPACRLATSRERSAVGHEIVIGLGGTGYTHGVAVGQPRRWVFVAVAGQRIATGPGGAPAVPVNGSGGAEMNAS